MHTRQAGVQGWRSGLALGKRFGRADTELPVSILVRSPPRPSHAHRQVPLLRPVLVRVHSTGDGSLPSGKHAKS